MNIFTEYEPYEFVRLFALRQMIRPLCFSSSLLIYAYTWHFNESTKLTIYFIPFNIRSDPRIIY